MATAMIDSVEGALQSSYYLSFSVHTTTTTSSIIIKPVLKWGLIYYISARGKSMGGRSMTVIDLLNAWYYLCPPTTYPRTGHTHIVSSYAIIHT